MRDSLKVTVRYQYIRMILMQAAASGVSFVFGAVAFWYFTNINIAKQILSAVFMIVNFIFLYTTAKKFAIMDNKSYTSLKPSKLKAVLIGCMIAGVNVVFMAVFRVLWLIYGTSEGIQGMLPTAYNMFFYLWSFPYNGIMNLYHGSFTVYSAAAMIVLPIAASIAGYIAGCKNFDFTSKLDSMMYERDE